MRGKEILKTYIALVVGTLPSEQGTLEHFLVHDSYRATVVSENHPDGKRAVLHYRVLETDGKTSLLEISLETGRYHQIRAQLSKIGYPVIGDRKYGSQSHWQDDEIALHHTKMVLKHPVTGQELILENNKLLHSQKRKTRAP
jgi:23S rRNA pseudouridine1911/1915/1917 synthase